MFARANVPEDRVHNIGCRCGCFERAYFWTVERQEGTRIHLSCPSCNSFAITYDASGNRVLRPPLSRTARDLGIASLVIFALAAGAFLRDPGLAVRLADAAAVRVRQQVAGVWLAPSHSSAGSPVAASTPMPRPEPPAARLAEYAIRGVRAAENAAVFISNGDRRSEVVTLAEEAGVPGDSV